MVIVQQGEVTNPLLSFMTIKDPHMNFGFANRIRYNHQADLLSKLDYVINWGKMNSINNIIMTGDITDTNEEKKWSFNQYVQNKKELLKFKEAGITIWSPAGNHDMFNGMVQTNDTVFGELTKENVIKHITKEPLFIPMGGVNSLGGSDGIVCFGVDYSKHKEQVEASLKGINDYDLPGQTLKMVVFHSHCTPAEIAVTDFTYENLVKNYPDIDVFICGHYHGGFPTTIVPKKDIIQNKGAYKTNTVIINNWSFQRVVRDYYNEMDVHTPEFEVVKIGWSISLNDFILERQTIKIPCKSYDEAFKPKAVELLKLTKKEQFEFFEKINFDDIPTGNDDEETLKNISSSTNVDPSIVTIALQYLNNVKIDYED